MFVSLVSELAFSENPPRGEDSYAELQDALKPSHLVTTDICKKLPICGKIKLFLELFDVEVPFMEEAGKLVAKRLICRIWASDEFIQDREEAFQLFDAFRRGKYVSDNSFIPAPSTAPIAANTTETRDEIRNPSIRDISNEVSQRFAHKCLKISRESNEYFPKFRDSYTRISEEF